MNEGLPPPSLEQTRILDHVRAGHNIMADCVAGSGKTTTIFHIAQACPEKKVLQITYNSQLKLEVRGKVKAAGLTNLEIHTYHSLCVSYYDRLAHTDDAMRNMIINDKKPLQRLPNIDLIIIDETQDMKHLFFQVVRKFITDMKALYKKVPQMVTFGDRYQSIYQFLGADYRYLTLSSNIWSSGDFLPLSLTTSYRLTNSMAAFVNNVMLGKNRIQADRTGPPVMYMTVNSFMIHFKLAKLLLGWLGSGAIKPDDIFILGGSLKGSKTPMRLLENELVSNKVLCYYPVSDERKLDEDIIEGKVVFSTFHQAKGRERKVVIIYGFDDTYYKFYNQDGNREVCPETLYVAATRAKERLIVLQDSRQSPLPFLQKNLFEMSMLPYVDVQRTAKSLLDVTSKPMPSIPQHNTTPTELVKFLKEPHIPQLQYIMKQIYTVEQEAEYSVDIPMKQQFEGGNYEDVSDINGLVIPAMYEAKAQEREESQIEIDVRQEYDNACAGGGYAFLDREYKKLGKVIKTPEGYTRLAIMYISLTEKIYNKIQQITTHKWITKKMVESCFVPLRKYISDSASYERPILYDCDKYSDYGIVKFSGRMDTVDDELVLELKCTASLTLEHQLQLMIYAWMWRHINANLGSRMFKLVNMRTGEVQTLDPNSYLIDEAMLILLHNKYEKLPAVSDSDFVELCVKGKIVISLPSLTIPNNCIEDKEEDNNPSGRCLIVDDDDDKPVVRKKPSGCLIVDDKPIVRKKPSRCLIVDD